MVAASSLCPRLQRQGGHLDQGREDGTRNQKICSDLYEYMNESCSVVSDSLRPHGLPSPWNSPGQDTGVGSLSLLQGIFPTQESNQGLLHCRRILYQLSYQDSPKDHRGSHPLVASNHQPFG